MSVLPCLQFNKLISLNGLEAVSLQHQVLHLAAPSWSLATLCLDSWCSMQLSLLQLLDLSHNKVKSLKPLGSLSGLLLRVSGHHVLTSACCVLTCYAGRLAGPKSLLQQYLPACPTKQLLQLEGMHNSSHPPPSNYLIKHPPPSPGSSEKSSALSPPKQVTAFGNFDTLCTCNAGALAATQPACCAVLACTPQCFALAHCTLPQPQPLVC